ncbi:hypothetical protein DL95DRAFT_445654 [Leptodontidium sp. 2 PMI_412]|nr:hypothetical protein DL95DRAFT_445654 [Leptodontidium sp. 2 PMI_412]
MSSTIHLSITIRTKPDKVAEMKALIVDLASYVEKTEPGILKYQIFEEETANGHVFIIQEIYEDQAAFDFHHGTESYQTATKRFVEWLASPVEIRRLTPFAGFASR